jgi:hypothetical protein
VVGRKQAGRFDQDELERKMNLLEEDYKAYFEKKCVNLDKHLKLQSFKVKILVQIFRPVLKPEVLDKK